MSPLKKLKRQIDAKKAITGTLLIFVMMMLVVFSSTLIIMEKPARAVEYTDFTYYKKITIDNTKVGADLTNFPVWVNDTDIAYANHMLADASDLYFTINNATQLNHEIEWWDSTTGELGVWVNVTSVSSSADTVFYMYYGDSDIGIDPNFNATDVWDGHYTGVFHMNDNTTSTINDSTSNLYHGIKTGANNPIQDIGQLGYAQNHSTDYINITNTNFTNKDFTMSLWFKWDGGGATDRTLIGCRGERQQYITVTRDSEDKKIQYAGADGSPTAATANDETGSGWYFAAARLNSSSDCSLIVNGIRQSSADAYSGPINAQAWTSYIGGDASAVDTPYKPFDGRIDEVRISNIVRSEEWLDTVYNNTYDVGSFLTFGSEQGGVPPSGFELKGLTSGLITWDGLAGDTVYCNTSGSGHEWMEVNMSINGTSNVTEIRVWVGDMDYGSTDYINVSNVTLYVADATNTTYYDFGTFSDTGNNISINETTWDAYGGGTNPFAGVGLQGWKNTSIFCIFELVLPVSVAEHTYESVTSTSWKVYIGYT